VTAALPTEIRDFAELVGLVLVLITLFTQQRHDKLHERRLNPTNFREAATEVGLDLLVLVATCAIFIFGLHLWWLAVSGVHPFRSGASAAAAVYVVAWLLLVGLIIWQAVVLVGAMLLTRDVQRATRPPKP
jgi:hypothetical protein